jgi:hypothetical protein
VMDVVAGLEEYLRENDVADVNDLIGAVEQ